ncbi:MAG: hypothetical protein M0R80_07095 [Proteobacteria bacterium]|jgi:hypothetical protein|nr:hypothetical protein [Pseudomonadota bacterium]
MLQLNGYLHRARLSKILGRSLSSSFEGPDAIREDSRALKQIVNFNAYCGCLILDAFGRSLLTSLHGEPVRSSVVQSKGALKDIIVSGVRDRSPRLQDLIVRYQQHPEDYYRETPVNGRIYHQQDRFLGTARVKRFRRIAEKASRYLIDFLFREVKSRADELAQERARRLGVAKSMLYTPIEEQIAEFAHAERRGLKLIRGGQLLETLPALPLNDILGFKVLCEGREVAEVTDRLADLKECSIEEQEAHAGSYNATHLVVRYRWPRDTVLSHSPAGRAMEILLERGCSCDIPEAFTSFVNAAEDDVVIEVIVCSWDELLESEIGRSMHEDRVLAQRSDQQYQGGVAKNIEWLMEYLFRFCLSPLSSLDEIPIHLWARYMPDYIDLLHGQLAGTSAEADFTKACRCGNVASDRGVSNFKYERTNESA